MSLKCATFVCQFFKLNRNVHNQNYIGDVWYNIGHIGLAIGDTSLAYQCFRLALTADHNHAEAFNNLGVLEMRRGKVEQARAFFVTAASLSPHLFEPNFNTASLSEKTGDLQTAYVVVQVDKKSRGTTIKQGEDLL